MKKSRPIIEVFRGRPSAQLALVGAFVAPVFVLYIVMLFSMLGEDFPSPREVAILAIGPAALVIGTVWIAWRAMRSRRADRVKANVMRLSSGQAKGWRIFAVLGVLLVVAIGSISGVQIGEEIHEATRTSTLSYRAEATPQGNGSYEVFVPAAAGMDSPRIVRGAGDVDRVETEHGTALHIRSDVAVVVEATGELVERHHGMYPFTMTLANPDRVEERETHASPDYSRTITNRGHWMDMVGQDPVKVSVVLVTEAEFGTHREALTTTVTPGWKTYMTDDIQPRPSGLFHIPWVFGALLILGIPTLLLGVVQGIGVVSLTVVSELDIRARRRSEEDGHGRSGGWI